MHYKRLQKYGKKLAVAVLTSAVLLASGATVYADDTGSICRRRIHRRQKLQKVQKM